MMIAAAVRWVRISTILDPLEASTTRSGTIDSAGQHHGRADEGRAGPLRPAGAHPGQGDPDQRGQEDELGEAGHRDLFAPDHDLLVGGVGDQDDREVVTTTIAEVATAAIAPEIRPGISSGGAVGVEGSPSVWRVGSFPLGFDRVRTSHGTSGLVRFDQLRPRERAGEGVHGGP